MYYLSHPGKGVERRVRHCCMVLLILFFFLLLVLLAFSVYEPSYSNGKPYTPIHTYMVEVGIDTLMVL